MNKLKPELSYELAAKIAIFLGSKGYTLGIRGKVAPFPPHPSL